MNEDPFKIRNVCVLILLVFGIILSQLAFAERDPQDHWKLFRMLIGSWEGDIDGKLGTGTGVRSCKFIMNKQFLLSRHSSVRLPQEKSTKGDQHEEIGIFSFDQERKKIVYREFLIEGFVNQYVCDVEENRFTCLTESVENGPGMRARWIITIANRYSFEETFELAGAGKEFSLLFTNHWTRTPKID